MSYSKLHSSIVHSSLWSEPPHVRILFVTLLAIADREGYVYGSRRGLERAANIGVLTTPCPWEALMSPDPDSSDKLRNPENEGRRIEEVPGGFRILNFLYYRGLRDDDDRREQNRRAQARHKAKVSQGKPRSAEISPDKPISEAEAEAEAEADTSTKVDVGNVDFVSTLSKDPTYAGIDVRREFGKMQNWCKVNNKQPTQRRFINWLNRTDKPLADSKPVDDWRRYDKQGRRVDASGRLMDSNQVREADMLHKWEEERKAAKAKL